MRHVTGPLVDALGFRTRPLGCIYALVAADKERHRALPAPQANLLAIFALPPPSRRVARTGDKICMKPRYLLSLLHASIVATIYVRVLLPSHLLTLLRLIYVGLSVTSVT